MSNKAKSDRQLTEEVLQRVVRTETRVVALGQKLGYDLVYDEEVTVVVESKSVYVAVMDVTLGNIIKAARQKNLHNTTVGVYFNGSRVAEVVV